MVLILKKINKIINSVAKSVIKIKNPSALEIS